MAIARVGDTPAEVLQAGVPAESARHVPPMKHSKLPNLPTMAGMGIRQLGGRPPQRTDLRQTVNVANLCRSCGARSAGTGPQQAVQPRAVVIPRSDDSRGTAAL